MWDIEVETLHGVRLGHKNIPVRSVGCYVPGGRYPMVASAHMSIVTAKVAGARSGYRLRAFHSRQATCGNIAAMFLAGADEIYSFAIVWRNVGLISWFVLVIMKPACETSLSHLSSKPAPLYSFCLWTKVTGRLYHACENACYTARIEAGSIAASGLRLWSR